jgi:DNA-binding beta-propeller fold protein YncE
MALDKKGNIFVGNYLGHNVSEYPPGKTTPSHVFDQGIVPVSIAIDAKNDVYVAAYGKKGVTQYAAGSLKTIRTITSGINYPRTVAIAPGGQVVVTNYGINEEAGSVTIYGAKGTAMLHEITDGVESPIAIALAVPHVSIGP